MSTGVDFQDGTGGSHLVFSIGIILAIFGLQVASMLPIKFRIGWPFLLRRLKYFKIDFQDGCHSGHLGFLIRTILAIFDLQVVLILPTKFRVYWPFGSGEEQNRFSRWRPWQPSKEFFIYKLPQYFQPS